MPNLSQEKRQRMLAFLDTIRQEHKDDDDVLIALGEIESELNAKKYGLAKKPYLKEDLDPAAIKVMQGIKKAFDPNNILNPRKVCFD